MADNEKVIDLFKDLMDSADDPRSDFIKDSEHVNPRDPDCLQNTSFMLSFEPPF